MFLRRKAPKISIRPKGGSKRKRLLVMSLLVAILLLTVVFVPQGLMLFVGMLPSSFAYFMDRNPKRTLFRCVLPLNTLAVAWVYLDAITQAKLGIPTVKGLLQTPAYWLIFAGGGLTGATIALVFPRIYRILEQFNYAGKISSMGRRRKQLVKKWGYDLVVAVAAETSEHDEEIYSFMLSKGYLSHPVHTAGHASARGNDNAGDNAGNRGSEKGQTTTAGGARIYDPEASADKEEQPNRPSS